MEKFNYKKILSKKYSWLAIIFLVGIISVVIGGQNVSAEWWEPSSPPPVEKFYAPLTTTGEPQAKEGYLLLDPENYHPTKDSSLDFIINKPLEVKGGGPKFSIPYVYSDRLIVDTDTLYVDSANEWVGLGTSIQNGGLEKLKIEGGSVQVGTSISPISGRAVSSYSSDNYGIYSDASASGLYGIYAVRTASDGLAVVGKSQGNNVGIRGESDSGAGIYAVTNSSIYGAVYGSNAQSGWAGYFDGRLNSASDMVADRFLPTNLQRSLIPFTSGQEVGSYSIDTWTNYPNTVRLAFDGTYVWVVTNDRSDSKNNLFKVRVSDGGVTGSFTVGTPNHNAIAFDGTYIWIVPTSSEEVFRFDPRDESYVTLDSSVAGFSPTPKESLAVSSINGTAYVWTSDPLAGVGGEIIKINSSDLSFETFDLNDIDTNLTNPDELTFDGTYLWVIADQAGQKNIVRLLATDPTDSPVIIDTVVLGCDPDEVYVDGEYVWCLENTANKLLRIWAENPNDTQHPMESFGPLGGADDRDMVFDGTYLWVVDYTNSNLYRYLVADPTVSVEFGLTFQPKNIIFDGTYLWITQADGDKDPLLHKFYSGTGMGHTYLDNIVSLDPVSQQAGSINVSSSSEIGTNITVGTDVDVEDNIWGGATDEEIVVADGVAGEANCSDGLFMKGVEIGADNKISKIYCREL